MNATYLRTPYRKTLDDLELNSVAGSEWLTISKGRSGDSIQLTSEGELRDLHYALGDLIRRIDAEAHRGG